MTADVSSAAAGDTTDPQALATIPEDSKYDDTANAKEMDTKDEETTENLNITKSHSILVTKANKPHKDNSSFGITSTTTKSEVASSPTKFANDLATNLKECQQSLASSITANIEEMRAERLAMAIENKVIRDQQTAQSKQMMVMFMQVQKQTQQLMTNSNYFQGPSSFNPTQPQQQFEYQRKPMMTTSNYFQGPTFFNPTQPQQQFDHQCEPMMTNYFQGPPSFNPTQPQQQFERQREPMMTNSMYFQGQPSFHPTQQQQQQQQQQQFYQREQHLAHQQEQHQPHLTQQQQQMAPPQKSQQLFTSPPFQRQQHQQHKHYSPEQPQQQCHAHQQHLDQQHYSLHPSHQECSPQKSPPKSQQLKCKADKLNYLDNRLDLPLANPFDLKSPNQTAWIKVVEPTVLQAKAEAADEIQRTLRDIS